MSSVILFATQTQRVNDVVRSELLIRSRFMGKFNEYKSCKQDWIIYELIWTYLDGLRPLISKVSEMKYNLDFTCNSSCYLLTIHQSYSSPSFIEYISDHFHVDPFLASFQLSQTLKAESSFSLKFQTRRLCQNLREQNYAFRFYFKVSHYKIH